MMMVILYNEVELVDGCGIVFVASDDLDMKNTVLPFGRCSRKRQRHGIKRQPTRKRLAVCQGCSIAQGIVGIEIGESGCCDDILEPATFSDALVRDRMLDGRPVVQSIDG